MRLISSSIHPFLDLNYKETISVLKKVKTHFSIEKSMSLQLIKEGKNLNFTFDLKTSKQKLGNIRLEYAIDFLKANGKLSRKVFMLSQSTINSNQKSFKKRQSFT
ncbi:MAG: hypothetical protein GY932_03520 [Arcobacter sp.]|nr:hypothetical protein [Arcobacter sp.]